MLREKGNATQGMNSLREFALCTKLKFASFRHLRNSNIPETAMKTKYRVLLDLEGRHNVFYFGAWGFFAYFSSWNGKIRC